MSTDTATPEAAQTHPFQAEVAELLRLMVHSVYSETDIFLRELISHASDACDRLRYEAIANSDLLVEDTRLAIRITPDAAACVRHYLAGGWRAGISINPLFDPTYVGRTGWAASVTDPVWEMLRDHALRPTHPLFDPARYLAGEPIDGEANFALAPGKVTR